MQDHLFLDAAQTVTAIHSYFAPESLNFPHGTRTAEVISNEALKSSHAGRGNVNLPALQRTFVDLFFAFALEFCIEKWQGFLVSFFSVPHEMKHETPPKIRENSEQNFGKSKWGLSNGGLRPLSAMCAQSSTIVHICGLFGPLCKGNFCRKMTTIVGNHRPLGRSTLSPPFAKPPFRLSRKIRGKIRDENSKNSGNLRSATFLT